MTIDQEFRESPTFELLEPYLDSNGLMAGYRVGGLVAQDPWRHSTYEATAPDGSLVALKVLGERSDQSRRFTRRFQRQLRLRASIGHPHLLPILDWGEVNGRFFVATPLHRVPTLADLLAAAPLRVAGALRLLAQVADALEAALARGLVHRDLEPDRVLVKPDGGGHVLLGDFGVAEPEWSTGMLDQPGSIPYLPPEKVRGEPLTRESNVYSLACILVECLTGNPPYVSEHAGVVAYAHVAEPPPRLSQDHPKLPEAIDDVVADAMAKDPAERLSSPRQFVDVAAATLGFDVPRSAPATERAVAREHSPGSGSRIAEFVDGPRGVLAVGVAATIGFGALGYVVGHSGDGTDTRAVPAAQKEPSPSRQAIDQALQRLDTRRVALRRRLAAAGSRTAQQSRATQLAAAYRDAVRSSPTGEPGAGRLRSSLEGAETAYLRLGAAARAGDRDRYAAAALAVERSERAVNQAMRRLAEG